MPEAISYPSDIAQANLFSINTSNYEVVVCRTLADIKQCMKIRYAIYCLRKGWEAAEDFPDQLESDEFDESAVHILLRDRHGGRAIGTARLIFAAPEEIDGNLPSLGWSAEFRDRARTMLPIARTVELSRLAIARGEQLGGAMRSGLPLLGLIKGLCRATAFDEVDTVCLTTTLALKRMLEGFGFHLHDLGVRIQHRGTRTPLYRDIPALLYSLYTVRPDVWRYITDNGETWPLDHAALEREILPS